MSCRARAFQRSAETALHQGMDAWAQPDADDLLHVAVSSGTALHRGCARIRQAGRMNGSPPLSGRPFIEAAVSWATEPRKARVAAPERAALHRGDRTYDLWGSYSAAVAALARAALHRGNFGVQALPGGAGRSPLSGRPFIEAWCRAASRRGGYTSPLLFGRPFIEARTGRCPAARGTPGRRS